MRSCATGERPNTIIQAQSVPVVSTSHTVSPRQTFPFVCTFHTVNPRNTFPLVCTSHTVNLRSTFSFVYAVDLLGPGVPRLVCRWPVAWLHQRPCTAQFQQQRLKTLARRVTPRPPWAAASLGWLPRSGDIKARCISRGSYDVIHDNQGQAGARRAQSTGFLFGAKEASHRHGVPRNQAKVSIFAQRELDCQDCGMEAIAKPTATSPPEPSQAKTTFVRITFTSCLPLNFSVVGSLPAYTWEEDQGHYK